MDLENLKEYIEFMDKHNLCELEIEEDGKRIKLKKSTGGEHIMIPQLKQTVEPPPQAPAAPEESTIKIKSPMVGTFYRAPSPGAKSYVEIGDTIKPGDILCIIEAMKLMNEIKAETAGKITRITVENGEPIEFGQTLFLVEPQ